MKIILTIVFGLFLYTPGYAEPTLEGCIQDHQVCTSRCMNMEGDGSKAACVAQCAGVEAQCAGRIGIQESEPFIRKKAKELEGLLDEFFGDILPDLEQKKQIPDPREPTDT